MASRTTLKDLSVPFLKCHGYSHAWDWTTDEGLTRNSRNKLVEYTEILTCMRCTMIRRDRYSLVHGRERIGRTYSPPEKYYLKKPAKGGRTPRSEVLDEFAVRRKLA